MFNVIEKYMNGIDFRRYSGDKIKRTGFSDSRHAKAWLNGFIKSNFEKGTYERIDGNDGSWVEIRRLDGVVILYDIAEAEED